MSDSEVAREETMPEAAAAEQTQLVPHEGGARAEDDAAGGALVPVGEAAPAVPAKRVVGVPYVKDGDSLDGGDFSVMIDMDEYRDTLFLFNDNVQDGRAETLEVGAGSACIRTYACAAHDYQAVGVPTGWMRGVPFASLDPQVRQTINAAVEKAITVFHLKGFKRIVFPCDAANRDAIGTSIFTIPDDVASYINKNLALLENRLTQPEKGFTLSQLKWCMVWVPYRLEEERRKRTQRVAMQSSPFASQLTSPTGLVKRARAATATHESSRPATIARYF